MLLLNSRLLRINSISVFKLNWIDQSTFSFQQRKDSHYKLICSPLQLRIINDQLMQLERAFQNPLGNSPEQADLK